jgi:hypothetical protein
VNGRSSLLRQAIRRRRAQLDARLSRGVVLLLGTTVVGLLPGFVLPFALALALSSEMSDTLLLGYGIALFFTGVVGVPVEANTLAEYGRNPLRVRGAWSSPFWRYLSRATAASGVAVLVFAPLLAWIYSAGDSGLWSVTAPMAVLSFVIAFSSAFSAVIAGRGLTTVVVGSQSLRAVPVLLALVVVTEPGIQMLAWLLVAGELLRLAVLLAVAMATDHRCEAPGHDEWRFRGSVWQMLSTSASQVSPALDRWFLAGSGVSGVITAYEVSDKVYYGGYQFITSGLLISRIARWGDLLACGRTAARAVVMRDLRVIGGTGLVVAPMLAALVGGLLWSGWTPDKWDTGLQWAIVNIITLPLGVCHGLLARAIVALRKQALFIRLTVVSVTSNALLNTIWFAVLGPVGIVVSSMCTRIFIFVAYLLVVTRLIKRAPVAPATQAVRT